MEQTGKMILIAAGVLALVGLWMIFGNKIPFLGKLPGDIRIEKENFSFYFPVATSILISIVLSGLLWIFHYLKR